MAILKDGFKSTIGFAQDPAIPEMELVSFTPPGLNMGGANNRTSMSNTAFRTQIPKVLKSLTSTSASVYYDPALMTVLLTILGVNGLITYTFPNLGTWTAWGWIEEATAGTLEEGTIPTLDLTIEHSLLNATQVEVAPAYTPPV